MRPAKITPLSETATAVISHSHISSCPNSAYGTVNRYGSGFHDGAAFVSSAQTTVWWPHTSQPYGSNPGRVRAHSTSTVEIASRPSPVSTAG